jgi:glycosyltransferase involved in cell wall biosynthesis
MRTQIQQPAVRPPASTGTRHRRYFPAVIDGGPPLKIVYIITKASPIGGAQIHVRDLAAAVVRKGHLPTVITSGSGTFIDDLRALNIPVVVLRHLTTPIRPLDDLRALRETHAALAGLRPDLIAAHSSKAGILARLAARRLGVPVVFTVHGWAFTPGVPPLEAAIYRRVERLVGPLASRIIAVSEYDRRLGLEARIAPPDRLVTVHNGMPDVGPALRADPSRTPVRLVMVARYGAQKDHPTLLRALAQVRQHSWELDLIGDGPLMADTEALAGELGLTGRVHFLGQRNDVARRLAAAQVSLLATNWEGFPLSILEAMRAGLPVVASDVGGVAESVRDGESGFLVARGDVTQLRDRIERLLTDPGLRARLGASGRQRFVQDFTLETSVAKTLAVYRETLAAGARRQGRPGDAGHGDPRSDARI